MDLKRSADLAIGAKRRFSCFLVPRSSLGPVDQTGPSGRGFIGAQPRLVVARKSPSPVPIPSTHPTSCLLTTDYCLLTADS